MTHPLHIQLSSFYLYLKDKSDNKATVGVKYLGKLNRVKEKYFSSTLQGGE